jgi:hypothetical protein
VQFVLEREVVHVPQLHRRVRRRSRQHAAVWTVKTKTMMVNGVVRNNVVKIDVVKNLTSKYDVVKNDVVKTLSGKYEVVTNDVVMNLTSKYNVVKIDVVKN